MTGSGTGVGVLEVAGREVGSAIGEQTKTVGAELGVIALQVVAAKLVDNEDYYQLGAGLVGGAEAGNRCE